MEVKYIIVGQGLAGSMLAWFLEKSNLSFIIIDEKKGETSSLKATGIINPITGRRFVKSWLVDDLMPFSKQTYRELEDVFNQDFFEETKIHRILQSMEQQNDWSAKLEDSSYKNYLKKKEIIYYNKNIINPFGCIEISPVYKINTPVLINSFSDYYHSKNKLRREYLDYDKLNISTEKITYKDVSAENIIFCEGYSVLKNPFFKTLPFLVSKGEVLHFRNKELRENVIIGGNSNITPLGNHLFSIGATYDWDDLSLATTLSKKEWLLDKLKANIDCPFEITNQKAGIRPTVKDRRPILGSHQTHKNVMIFNGLGTKGLSLSPFFSNHFVSVLLEKETLLPEISIERFFR